MHRSLRDRVVLVTGGSLGVGLAAGAAFAREGAHVVLNARREGPLSEALATLPDPSRHRVVAGDITDPAVQDRLVSTAREAFGRIDGVVNNAGAHFRGDVHSQPADRLATMVDVNLRAPIALTRRILDDLRANDGFVVNVASLAGMVPLDGAATYSATKFGLRAFSLALREELAETGVDVCVVSPGPIDTGFIMDDIDQVDDIVFSQSMCTAEHVAEMIVQCARDGRAERAWPASGARLATLSYLWPGLRRWFKPRMREKGRKVKESLRRQRRDG